MRHAHGARKRGHDAEQHATMLRETRRKSKSIRQPGLVLWPSPLDHNGRLDVAAGVRGGGVK